VARAAAARCRWLRRTDRGPIVHGCFTLSLLPKLSIEIYGVTGFGVGLNYGLNRVRFPAPLPVGGELRLGVELHEVRSVPGGGVEYITRNTFELRGSSKPVCMADWIVREYP
jgi:acyl dehydratase